jgi:antiviral defense system Shedu protein SduA
VQKGDEVVIPEGVLGISANPLRGSGHLTRYGLSWFAEHVFGIDISKRREDFPAALRSLIQSNEGFFEGAEYLKGLDLSDPANEEEMIRRIDANKKSIEWWGYLAAVFCTVALQAIENGNAAEAAWAMTTAERLRSLATFKAYFEEAVFIGHSARRLVDLMRTWDSHKGNNDEGFWQVQLSENAYAISQLFSVPVTFIRERAYVGGMSFEGTDARFLDLVFSSGSANEAILVEIKTPMTPLLGPQYRTNAYPPSRELGGSIVQVNDYCHSLREFLLTRRTSVELNAFNPRRVVIIGNYERELTDVKMKSSFELFRTSLAGVDVITFDELFRKIDHLAKLFNIVRAATSQPAGG